MLGSGLNLVTTVIGFGMSATFIVFVCARLICGRAARAEADAAAAAAARAMAPGPAPFDFDIEFRTADLDRTIEHTRSGLEPFVVAAIPTMNYSCEAFHSKDDAQCMVTEANDLSDMPDLVEGPTRWKSYCVPCS